MLNEILVIGLIGQAKLLSEPPGSIAAFATFRVIHDEAKIIYVIFVIPHPTNISMVSGIAHVRGNINKSAMN